MDERPREDVDPVTEAAPVRTPAIPPRVMRRVPWRYNLGSVMLLIAVAAVGLGLGMHERTLVPGACALVVGSLTIGRAAPILIHRRNTGRKVGVADFLSITLGSCAVAMILVFQCAMALCFFISVFDSHDLSTFVGPDSMYRLIFAAVEIYCLASLHHVARHVYPPRD